MSLVSLQPPTETQLLLQLSPMARALGLDPRELSEEQTMLLLAEIEHQEAMAALRSQIGGLTPPYFDPNKSPTQEQISEANRWQEDYEELTLMLVQEEHCHKDPLDSEFGESMKERTLSHWLKSPYLDFRAQGALDELRQAQRGKQARG